MLRVYGIKTDKQTGEIIKDHSVIFHSISEDDLKNRGIKTAMENGYTITEIIDLGNFANHYTERRVFQKQ